MIFRGIYKKQCKLNFAYDAEEAKLGFQVWSPFCVLFNRDDN